MMFEKKYIFILLIIIITLIIFYIKSRIEFEKLKKEKIALEILAKELISTLEEITNVVNNV